MVTSRSLNLALLPVCTNEPATLHQVPLLMGISWNTWHRKIG